MFSSRNNSSFSACPCNKIIFWMSSDSNNWNVCHIFLHSFLALRTLDRSGCSAAPDTWMDQMLGIFLKHVLPMKLRWIIFPKVDFWSELLVATKLSDQTACLETAQRRLGDAVSFVESSTVWMELINTKYFSIFLNSKKWAIPGESSRWCDWLLHFYHSVSHSGQLHYAPVYLA